MFYEMIKELCFVLVMGTIGATLCILIGNKLTDYLYEKENKKDN